MIHRGGKCRTAAYHKRGRNCRHHPGRHAVLLIEGGHRESSPVAATYVDAASQASAKIQKDYCVTTNDRANAAISALLEPSSNPSNALFKAAAQSNRASVASGRAAARYVI